VYTLRALDTDLGSFTTGDAADDTPPEPVTLGPVTARAFALGEACQNSCVHANPGRRLEAEAGVAAAGETVLLEVTRGAFVTELPVGPVGFGEAFWDHFSWGYLLCTPTAPVFSAGEEICVRTLVIDGAGHQTYGLPECVTVSACETIVQDFVCIPDDSTCAEAPFPPDAAPAPDAGGAGDDDGEGASGGCAAGGGAAGGLAALLVMALGGFLARRRRMA
jgi:MYXO-CTERM domain-containing protein